MTEKARNDRETVSFRLNEENGGISMADNYLEKKFEDMRARSEANRAKEERARQRAWKKRMEAYRKKLEEQK